MDNEGKKDELNTKIIDVGIWVVPGISFAVVSVAVAILAVFIIIVISAVFSA